MSGSGCGNVQNVCFPFSITYMYMTTFPDATFWKHAINDWWASASTIHCKLRVMRHFAHKSKLQPPEVNQACNKKSKAIRLGSECGVCMGVSRNKVGMPRSGRGFVNFAFCTFQLQSVYATIFADLTFWNYESTHYEDVPTAIHINWKGQVLGINH